MPPESGEPLKASAVARGDRQGTEIRPPMSSDADSSTNASVFPIQTGDSFRSGAATYFPCSCSPTSNADLSTEAGVACDERTTAAVAKSRSTSGAIRVGSAAQAVAWRFPQFRLNPVMCRVLPNGEELLLKTESGQSPHVFFGAPEPQDSGADQQSFVGAGNRPRLCENPLPVTLSDP